MNQVFPYDNVVADLFVLVVGFGFHWIGQLVSVVNWDIAARIGLQEQDAPPEYRVYEHGITVADFAIGWIYGIAGLGSCWAPRGGISYHGCRESCWFTTALVSGSGREIR